MINGLERLDVLMTDNMPLSLHKKIMVFLAAHLAESQVAQLYMLGSSLGHTHTHLVTPADSWKNQSVFKLGH